MSIMEQLEAEAKLCEQFNQVSNLSFSTVLSITAKLSQYLGPNNDNYGYFSVVNSCQLRTEPIQDIKKCNIKSMLMTTLVNQVNYQKVKHLLATNTELPQTLMTVFGNYQEIMTQNNWHLEFIEVPLKPFKLLALFITNSPQPQWLALGRPLTLYNSTANANYFGVVNDNSNNIRIATNGKILNLHTLYHGENPAQVYQDKLVNLDANINQAAMLTKINQAYAQVIAYLESHNITPETTDTGSQNYGVLYLDLNWLIAYQNKLNHNYQELDTSKLSQNPLFKEVLTYLANQIKD